LGTQCIIVSCTESKSTDIIEVVVDTLALYGHQITYCKSRVDIFLTKYCAVVQRGVYCLR